MRHILLTLSACLAFAAGYAEKPVKGAHLRLENATYNFGDVPRKGGDLVREFRFVNDGKQTGFGEWFYGESCGQCYVRR